MNIIWRKNWYLTIYRVFRIFYKYKAKFIILIEKKVVLDNFYKKLCKHKIKASISCLSNSSLLNRNLGDFLLVFCVNYRWKSDNWIICNL